MKFVKIFIILCIILLFSSCIEINNDEQTSNAPEVSVYPKESEIIIPPLVSSETILPENIKPSETLYIIYPAYNIMRYYKLDEWSVKIKEKFGLDIYVMYDHKLPKVSLQEPSPYTILYLNYTKGHPYEYNTKVFMYSDDNITYDLSPYYAKYNWDGLVNEKYRELLTDNGKIHAIPTYNEKYILPRYYNKQYITNLGISIPTNISEFYNYLKLSKDLNSDDSSFYPICIFGPYITKSTADIFRAFGVYFNSTDNLSITYNPNTQSFEDGVFSDGIESALGYIRNLQYEDLLLVTGVTYSQGGNGTPRVVFNDDYGNINKNFASEYGVVYIPDKQGFIREGINNHIGTAYESINGYYLTGPNTHNVCEVKSDLAFYLIPKSNEKINETIELLNSILTDNKYYADFRYGIEDVDYIANNNEIVPNTILGSYLDLKNIVNVNDPNTSLIPNSIQIINELGVNQWFEKSVFTSYHTYISSDSFTPHSQHGLIGMLFQESILVDEAIEEYKRQFKIIGLENIINNLNERLGTETKYDYR